MNPSVVAAAIGVSGTVIVGVAGFGASIWNTRKIIADARESRIWDQRSKVYVDVLAAMDYRKQKRQFDMRLRTDEQTRQREQDALGRYKEPDWQELEACLQAFASEFVFKAVRASVEADEDLTEGFKLLRTADMQSPDPQKRRSAEVARKAFWKVREASDMADRIAIESIRAELQGASQPPAPWRSTFGAPDPFLGGRSYRLTGVRTQKRVGEH
jgi:hypothetical protein